MSVQYSEKSDAILTQIRAQLPIAHNAQSIQLDKKLAIVREISLSGDPSRLNELQRMLTQILDEISRSKSTCERFSPLLSEIAHCLECNGHYAEAVAVAEQALNACQTTSESWAARKAHNVAAACYLRVCDYGKSIEHLTKSLKIARKTGDNTGRLACLANAVSLFNEMDALDESLALCLKVRDEPCVNALEWLLRFQNALNGAHVAVRLHDVSALQLFVTDGEESKTLGLSRISELSLVQHFTNRLILLAWTGQAAKAYKIAERTFKFKERVGNKLVLGLLLAARARCCACVSDNYEQRRTRAHMRRALKAYENLTFIYPDLIFALMAMYSGKRVQILRERLSLRLQMYQVTIQHAGFFAQLRSQAIDLRSLDFRRLQNPVYQIPSELAAAGGRNAKSTLATSLRLSVINESFNNFPLGEKVAGSDLRSDRYCIAENWAVAADFASSNRSGFCFRVGRIARMVGERSGWDGANGEALELASRLFDVGLLLTDAPSGASRGLGGINPEHLGREHTWAGHFILYDSNEKVLTLAAGIALSHREWFNGCGYPRGLVGCDIPVEARICAVAREFCALLDLYGNSRRGFAQALAQCNSMAGVQLDPKMVSCLNDLLVPPVDDVMRRLLIRAVSSSLVR